MHSGRQRVAELWHRLPVTLLDGCGALLLVVALALGPREAGDRLYRLLPIAGFAVLIVSSILAIREPVRGALVRSPARLIGVALVTLAVVLLVIWALARM